MSIEEQLQEEQDFIKYQQRTQEKLILLDKDTPMFKIELLKLGAYPYNLEDKEFLIVKVNDNYFDFLKQGKLYYKW